MTVERAIVARARPQIIAGLAWKLLMEEAGKGCSPELAPVPVCLEPPYRDFRQETDILAHAKGPNYIPLQTPTEDDLLRFTVWETPELACDWSRAERLLKQLQSCRHSLAFEIVGNESQISLSFLCDKRDAPVLCAAFLGEFPDCVLAHSECPRLSQISPERWRWTACREYYCPPPYSHLFTRPGELQYSPLAPLLNIMARLPASAEGIYQVLFAPVQHDWHSHISRLLDLEFDESMYGGMQPYFRYAQQKPSRDLRGTALDINEKSHNDKCVFAAVARVAVVSSRLLDSEESLSALAVPVSLFQHGGRRLEYITHEDFGSQLVPIGLRAMFLSGLSYRPGFLLNSQELSGFVHLPPIPGTQQRATSVNILDGLPPTSTGVESGTLIGDRKYAGMSIPIHIPPPFRARSGHVIGKSGTGKSRFLEAISLHDIEQGYGIALIDPHGDVSYRLLGSLPEHCLERVVYFDPGDEEWIFQWNVLARRAGQDPSRVADEFAKALREISEGSGDRLAHILKQTVTGLLYLEGSTLADVQAVLQSRPEERQHLARQVLAVVDNPTTHRFWETEIKAYKPADVQPVLHKLGKLMAPRGVSLMFSQPVNKLDFRRVMDEGLIFVADLSRTGADAKNILGTFIMSWIYLAAESRSDIPEHLCKPFYAYADEAYRFISGPMTEFIAQTRKRNVSVTVAHQFLSQFSTADIDALGTTGFTVLFGILHKDAERMLRMLGAEVPPEDLLAFEPRDALVRIGAEWVKVRTPERPATVNDEVRNRAIALSREKYYCRATEISCDSALFGHRKVRPTAVPPVEDEETDYVFDTL